MSNNIIDKIQLSGVTYDIGGSGTVSTAITSGDTNAVAGGAVYDKFDEVEQVTARALIDLNDALSGKQDTLSAGTNITISGNVISASGNPTVELTQAEYDALVSAGTVASDTYYIITDASPIDMSQYWTSAETQSAITESISGKVNTSTYTAYTAATDSRIGGIESDMYSKVDSIYLDTQYTDGVKIQYYGSNGGQYIGNLTLFDVGSGLTMDFSGNTWVLSSSGGSGTASTAITSGDTNPVQGGVLYNKFDEIEQVTARALNQLSEGQEVTARALVDLNDKIASGVTSATVESMISAATSGKTDTTAFTAHTASTVHMTTTEKTNLDSLATNIAAISGITSTKVGNWDTASTNSHTHSNKTVLDGINSTKVSNWDGAATNASNAITALGGLKLVKLSQSAYDALTTKDPNTLYVIVN